MQRQLLSAQYSILISLVAGSVFQATILQLGLDVLGYSTFDSYGVHAPDIFCCRHQVQISKAEQKGEHPLLTRSLPSCYPAVLRIHHSNHAVEVLCCACCYPVLGTLHLRTASVSERLGGSGLPTCIISSQFGQPSLRKAAGIITMEHSKQALSCFDLAWVGMSATGADIL